MAEETSGEVVREQSESVAAANLKVLGDGPATVQNLAMQDALEARYGWRSINQAIVAKVAEAIITTQPGEGGADVAALGQLMKGLQITPPPTQTGNTTVA
jgi:hypothetical protein